MKQVEPKKQKKEVNELPLATMVIKEYKELNKTYVKTNKRLIHVIIILLTLLAVETTYIVLYWESMNPNSGVIQRKVCE